MVVAMCLLAGGVATSLACICVGWRHIRKTTIGVATLRIRIEGLRSRLERLEGRW